MSLFTLHLSICFPVSNISTIFSGFIVYNVTQKGSSSDSVRCFVQVFDKNDTQVTAYNECAGLLEIGNANFWWPYLMNPNAGYLYTFKVMFEQVRSTCSYSREPGIS